MPFLSRRIAALLTLAAVLILVGVTAEKHASSVASMSVLEIEEALQVGTPMKFGKQALTAPGMPIGARSQCI